MSTKEEVLAILNRNSEDYISGEEMAQMLNVSRASIWKAVKALEDDGYIIEGITKKGYRLVSTDILNQEVLEKLIDIPVYYYSEIDSTNTEAKRLINKGIKAPFVVISELQTGGRGRRGRTFVSEKGGTYYSLVVNNDNTFDTESVTTRASLGTTDAIDSLGFDTQIKWVNDVYINGKKCVGILTEGVLSMEENRISEIIIGIGVNFGTKNFPDELKDICTSLFPDGITPISRAEFLARQIKCVINTLHENDYIKRYRAKCFVIGLDLNVIRVDKTKRAKCLDVDDNAHLVVQYEDGQIEHLSSGEVTIRPCWENSLDYIYLHLELLCYRK